MVTAIKDLPRDEIVLQGSSACGGCPAASALRIVGKAFGPNAVCLMTPSCTVASIGAAPRASFNYPILNINFATAGSSAAGVVAAYESLAAKGRLEGEAPLVFNWIGDGGTYDIGFQALSAAAERNDNFIHICYNNEAYSNTGVQRSGATPRFATTTTTPGGKPQNKKNLPLLMLDHQIPYMATASVAYPADLYDKLVKAKSVEGFRYIEIHAPCYTGWKFASSDTVAISRQAVTSGAWLLYEAVDGQINFSNPTKGIVEGKIKRTPLEDYLSGQGRFRHLMQDPEKAAKIAALEAEIEAEIEEIRARAAR